MCMSSLILYVYCDSVHTACTLPFHQVFKMKALEYLCSCVLSGHPRVCSASLLSLSSFQMTDIPSSLLPGHLESHDRSHDELCDLSVTGSQLVNLFRIVPHNSFPELVRLLTAMLQQEAATIGRGVVSTALTQAQVRDHVIHV